MNNCSFIIKEGSKAVLLSGESGIGKTSILYLIAKFMNPISGTILINNSVNILDIDNQAYINNIFYVTQMQPLLGNTVRDILFWGTTSENVDIGKILSMVNGCFKWWWGGETKD